MEKASANKDIAILFDFDGTVGDTETPAMEVAFWELAPYLANTRESAIRCSHTPLPPSAVELVCGFCFGLWSCCGYTYYACILVPCSPVNTSYIVMSVQQYR